MRSMLGAIPRYESAARQVKTGYPHWPIEEYGGFPGARTGVDFHRGYTGKHLPKEYIERGQIYFGFGVDANCFRSLSKSSATRAGCMARRQ